MDYTYETLIINTYNASFQFFNTFNDVFNDVQISCTCVSLPNFIGFANVVDCFVNLLNTGRLQN